jgi:hypothetical protein
MQNGLPVLANVNLGNDLADLIRHENVGEVCESNNVNELEDHLQKLIVQIDTDKAMSERCTNLFKNNFSVAHIAHQISSALSK